MLKFIKCQEHVFIEHCGIALENFNQSFMVGKFKGQVLNFLVRGSFRFNRPEITNWLLPEMWWLLFVSLWFPCCVVHISFSYKCQIADWLWVNFLVNRSFISLCLARTLSQYAFCCVLLFQLMWLLLLGQVLLYRPFWACKFFQIFLV